MSGENFLHGEPYPYGFFSPNDIINAPTQLEFQKKLGEKSPSGKLVLHYTLFVH